jgi:hypothetical protein
MHKTIFVFVVAAITFSALTAAIATPQAFAINDKFTTDCEGPGSSGGPGDCPGGSEGSGPHDEIVTNPSGKNQPPGQQEED